MPPERRALATLASLLACTGMGCAPYDASVRLAIEGTEALALTSGGGYRIEIRDANGAPIPGLEPRFVSFSEGEQTVGVRIARLVPEARRSLSDGKRLPAIIRVEARPQADGAPVAIGATRVGLRRNHPVKATVTLRADPRPLGQGFDLRYATEWPALSQGEIAAPDSSVSVEHSPPVPEGLAFHLWICTPDCEAGDARWLGEVRPEIGAGAAGDAERFFVGDEQALIVQPHTLKITAEDAAFSGASLASPLGFVVASGALAENRRAALEALLSTRTEDLQGQQQVVSADAPRILTQLGIASTHGAFAATAGRDDGYIRSHTGHTFWTVASGVPGSPSLPTEAPLPDDDDPRGLLGNATGSVKGRLLRLDEEATAAAELTTVPEVSQAALDLSATLAQIRIDTCQAWGTSISILMGSCTAPVPQGCDPTLCAGISVPATGFSAAAEQNLTALSDATARATTLEDGSAGDPLIEALERMTRFTATAADSGP